ncbi:hypothetical protein RHDC3_00232 [Rhodocyclaceae bacterium]|nr:hypothetical protein RHDC3_00232 [Rhodocyclaceae bacterium]
MWVNKSVNPSSTHAAQARPPRMTPGTVDAAGYATHRATARNSSAATDPKAMYRSCPARDEGSTWQSQFNIGGPAQAPDGLSSQATEPARGLGPVGFNLPSLRSACRNVKGTCSTSPQAATYCTLKPIQRRPAARRTVGHGPFGAPRGALWGPRCGACTAGGAFSWSSPAFLCPLVPPPALGKSPAPAGSGIRHILETPDRPQAAARLCIPVPSKPQLSRAFHRLGPRWVRRHQWAEKGGQA